MWYHQKEEGGIYMALINCPECEKQISDKAESCPNCGYPIINYVKKTTNYDVRLGSNKNSDYRLAAIYFIRLTTGVGLVEVKELLDNAPSTVFRNLPNDIANKAVQIFNGLHCDAELIPTCSQESSEEVQKKILEYLSDPKNAPKQSVRCPYCNSVNCAKTSFSKKAGKVALFGLFAVGEVSKKWHCNNCGSNFG